jgi:predicted Co/Zn/Cd cation transporter (cation efflux family)
VSFYFPELPETAGGWGFAVAGGLIGLVVFTLHHWFDSPFDGIGMVAGAALTVFALTDAYLIADTLDDRKRTTEASR